MIENVNEKMIEEIIRKVIEQQMGAAKPAFEKRERCKWCYGD